MHPLTLAGNRPRMDSPMSVPRAVNLTVHHPRCAAPTASAPAGPSQLQTADGLDGLLDSIRNRFGDNMGFQLNVYTGYAIIERVAPDNSHVEQDYVS